MAVKLQQVNMEGNGHTYISKIDGETFWLTDLDRNGKIEAGKDKIVKLVSVMDGTLGIALEDEVKGGQFDRINQLVSPLITRFQQNLSGELRRVRDRKEMTWDCFDLPPAGKGMTYGGLALIRDRDGDRQIDEVVCSTSGGTGVFIADPGMRASLQIFNGLIKSCTPGK